MGHGGLISIIISNYYQFKSSKKEKVSQLVHAPGTRYIISPAVPVVPDSSSLAHETIDCEI